MTQQKKLSYCVVLIVLSVLACGQFQPSVATPVPPDALPLTFTSEPNQTHTPIQTLIQPTHISLPTFTSTQTLVTTHTPNPTATYPPPGTGPFVRVISLTEPLPNLYDEVQVRVPDDGSVWVITSQSIARWDGKDWENVHSMGQDMLADVDDSGRLWLLQNNGDKISVWQNEQWTTYGTDSGWTSANAVKSGWWVPKPWKVSVAADGTLWLPTETDIRSFDGQSWTIYTREEMGFPTQDPEWEDMAGIDHQIALVDGGKQVWVGECGYSGPGPISRPGLRWFDGVTWSGADAPVGQACVSVVDVDLAGNVWIGAQDVIWRYEPTLLKWTPYYLPESFLLGYNFTYTRDLIVDCSGDIWVYLQYCGGAGCDINTKLHRIQDGDWSQVFENDEWFIPLQQLALDGNGQGWLFWDGNVFQLIGSEVTSVAALSALGMDISSNGNVWVVAGHENDAALWVLEPHGD